MSSVQLFSTRCRASLLFISIVLVLVAAAGWLTDHSLASQPGKQQARPTITQRPQTAVSVMEQTDPSRRSEFESLFTVNDPFFRQQWALMNTGQKMGGQLGLPGADLNAPSVWDSATGAGVDVAVLDTGMRTGHPDLAGKVDFAKSVVPGQPGGTSDRDGHGTALAGVIAAEANNGIGIAGLAFDSRLVNIKISDDGTTSDREIVHGIKSIPSNTGIANLSWGGAGYTPLLKNAFKRNPRTLFVVAGGNEGENNDKRPEYPCALKVENILCVGASDNRDRVSPFSNYGKRSVDLFAPGQAVKVIGLKDSYPVVDGTSLSAPYVAAAAALLKQQDPGLTPVQLKYRLIGSTLKKRAFAGKSVSGGRLDIEAALRAKDSSDPAPTVSVTPISLGHKRMAKFRVKTSAPGARECRIDGSVDWVGCPPDLVINGANLRNGTHTLEVRAVNMAGMAGASASAEFEINRVRPTIGRVNYRVLKVRGKMAKVKVWLRVDGANRVWCGVRKLKRCSKTRTMWVRTGVRTLRVKAVNKFNNPSTARFRLKIKKTSRKVGA